MTGLFAAMLSCSKMNDLHDGYLDGEIIYAAKVDSAEALAGENRVELNVTVRSQRVETVRVFWNNYADSTDIAVGNQVGMFRKMLENLAENSYIFQLVSFDGFGNRSLPFETSGSVYGDRFRSTLSNRGIQSVYAGDGSLTVNWGGAMDNATGSELVYTDREGREQTLWIPVTDASTTVAGWASGLRYRTLFLPEATAIDTFYADWRTVGDIPFRYSTAGWTAESRNGNHNWGANGGAPGLVLDGDINTGWHSAPSSPLPQCLVIDMQESRGVHHLVFRHLPEGLTSNWIYFKTIEVYLSDTPVTPDEYQPAWGTPAAVYQYPGGIDGFTVELAPDSRGRYLVLYFPDSSTNTYISFAELEVYRE
jgi:hypothetical protein